jgi:phosphopantothenoylcysteine decarboxylase/phosphopantothenate--cysteine ligase
VLLVSGPSALPDPEGVEVVRVETAVEMKDAVADRLREADASIFAAAVADFRPAEARTRKVKRGEEGDALDLALTANPDVARDTRAARKPGSVAVGFALETEDLVAHAGRKLDAKGFDLIVANDATEVGAGFEVDTNRVTILTADGEPEVLPLQSKHEVAEAVLDRVGARLGAA